MGRRKRRIVQGGRLYVVKYLRYSRPRNERNDDIEMVELVTNRVLPTSYLQKTYILT